MCWLAKPVNVLDGEVYCLQALFPAPLFGIAQATLLPFLVDKDKVGPTATNSIRSMMMMSPLPNSLVSKPSRVVLSSCFLTS